MKRDLKLNISELWQVEHGIETARNALLEIMEASVWFLTVLKEQDRQAIFGKYLQTRQAHGEITKKHTYTILP